MIVAIKHIYSARYSEFERKVKDAVDDMQSGRLEVEIQYNGHKSSTYTALVIGRR